MLANPLKSEQNDWYFADEICKCKLLKQNHWFYSNLTEVFAYGSDWPLVNIDFCDDVAPKKYLKPLTKPVLS